MKATHVKKGDTVKILSGRDRGKTGKVAAVLTKSGRASVEGANIIVRHQRPKKAGEKGQRLKVPMPIPLSRLMLVCPHCKKPTREAHTLEQGQKVRICKNCKKTI